MKHFIRLIVIPLTCIFIFLIYKSVLNSKQMEYMSWVYRTMSYIIPVYYFIFLNIAIKDYNVEEVKAIFGAITCVCIIACFSFLIYAPIALLIVVILSIFILKQKESDTQKGTLWFFTNVWLIFISIAIIICVSIFSGTERIINGPYDVVERRTFFNYSCQYYKVENFMVRSTIEVKMENE